LRFDKPERKRGAIAPNTLRAVLKIAAASWLALAALLNTARAEEPAKESGILTVLFENDVFYRADRDYTNGVQLAWTSPSLASGDWAVNLADKLPFFSHTSDVRKTYALGQDIFTPSNIALTNPPLTDHPYPGIFTPPSDCSAKPPTPRTRPWRASINCSCNSASSGHGPSRKRRRNSCTR
jgi:hypothetical protein